MKRRGRPSEGDRSAAGSEGDGRGGAWEGNRDERLRPRANASRRGGSDVLPFASVEGAVVHLRLKAVPGASRDAIAGLLGDRLKVRVAAPPEGGRANEAILRLLATSLGVSPTSVSIVHGHASPSKTARIEKVSESVIERLRAIASA